ncbi:MAG: UDP-N-acetylmuramate dehydrogenase [Fibrobacter sp.]|nr:UDP-N-acetylmuramate dehydrogenase [Fibrobacter sp.]
MQILENEPMSKHTSFRVGGPARFFVKAETIDELKQAITLAAEKSLPYFTLGNGTNLLVADKGFEGVVITLAGEFSKISDMGTGSFKVGAAVPLGRFARMALKQGYAGIHKLAGIPGTLGGAIYMNAGAYGQEIGTHCTQVATLDANGNIREYSNNDCAFGYRRSAFQKTGKNGAAHPAGRAFNEDIAQAEIILSATFLLESANTAGESQEQTVVRLEAELAECMAKRKATQPLNMPNAGSTFKRLERGSVDMPQQIAPGYYIEQAGLKGYRIGGAEVSTLHANFIVNAGGATAKDILNLSDYVKTKVAEKFGIELQREIVLLGSF